MKSTLISSALVLIIVLSVVFFLNHKVNQRISEIDSSAKQIQLCFELFDRRCEVLEKQVAQLKQTTPANTVPPVKDNSPKDKSSHDSDSEVNPKGKSAPEEKSRPEEKNAPEDKSTADAKSASDDSPSKDLPPPVEPPKKNLNMEEYRTESQKLISRQNICRERLAKLKSANANILTMKNELDRINGLMNDTRYICFDRCIHFQGIVFRRVMKTHKVQPNQLGYYHTINGQLSHKEKKKWNQVPVTYTCLVHKITWSEAEAVNYKNTHYVPLSELEIKQKNLQKSLARAIERDPNASDVKRLEQEIADLEKQLSDLRKKYGIADADTSEKGNDSSGDHDASGAGAANPLSGNLKKGLVYSASFLQSGRRIHLGVPSNGITYIFTVANYSSAQHNVFELHSPNRHQLTLQRRRRNNLEVETIWGSEGFSCNYIEDGAQHTILIVASTESIRVYVDKMSIGSRRGRDFYNSMIIERIQANVDATNVRVWNRSLSEEEIQEAFNLNGNRSGEYRREGLPRRRIRNGNWRTTPHNLTGNTGPDFIVSQSSTYDNREAYQAMDGRLEHIAHSHTTSGNNQWWRIDFVKPVAVRQITWKWRRNKDGGLIDESSWGDAVKKTMLQGSNDGNLWTNIQNITHRGHGDLTIRVNCYTPYRYYRLLGLTHGYLIIGEIEFTYCEIKTENEKTASAPASIDERSPIVYLPLQKRGGVVSSANPKITWGGAEFKFDQSLNRDVAYFKKSCQSNSLTVACDKLPFGNAPFTLSCWVKMVSASGAAPRVILGFGTTPWRPTFNALCVDDRTQKVRLDNWSRTGPLSNMTACDSQWHCITGTFDGRVSKLFIDGRLQAESSNIVYNAGGGRDRNSKISIGTFWAGDDVSMYIAEVKVYNYAISNDQVRSEYQRFAACRRY